MNNKNNYNPSNSLKMIVLTLLALTFYLESAKACLIFETLDKKPGVKLVTSDIGQDCTEQMIFSLALLNFYILHNLPECNHSNHLLKVASVFGLAGEFLMFHSGEKHLKVIRETFEKKYLTYACCLQPEIADCSKVTIPATTTCTDHLNALFPSSIELGYVSTEVTRRRFFIYKTLQKMYQAVSEISKSNTPLPCYPYNKIHSLKKDGPIFTAFFGNKGVKLPEDNFTLEDLSKIAMNISSILFRSIYTFAQTMSTNTYKIQQFRGQFPWTTFSAQVHVGKKSGLGYLHNANAATGRSTLLWGSGHGDFNEFACINEAGILDLDCNSALELPEVNVESNPKYNQIINVTNKVLAGDFTIKNLISLEEDESNDDEKSKEIIFSSQDATKIQSFLEKFIDSLYYPSIKNSLPETLKIKIPPTQDKIVRP